MISTHGTTFAIVYPYGMLDSPFQRLAPKMGSGIFLRVYTVIFPLTTGQKICALQITFYRLFCIQLA
jgi:hypothetical protein